MRSPNLNVKHANHSNQRYLPRDVDEDDKQRLVDTGLSPEEIFDANGVIAWLNYINRITYGLRARSNGYYFGRNRLPDPADLQRSGDAFSVSRKI